MTRNERLQQYVDEFMEELKAIIDAHFAAVKKAIQEDEE